MIDILRMKEHMFRPKILIGDKKEFISDAPMLACSLPTPKLLETMIKIPSLIPNKPARAVSLKKLTFLMFVHHKHMIETKQLLPEGEEPGDQNSNIIFLAGLEG